VASQDVRETPSEQQPRGDNNDSDDRRNERLSCDHHSQDNQPDGQDAGHATSGQVTTTCRGRTLPSGTATSTSPRECPVDPRAPNAGKPGDLALGHPGLKRGGQKPGDRRVGLGIGCLRGPERIAVSRELLAE
jgi:hypothetical protein